MFRNRLCKPSACLAAALALAAGTFVPAASAGWDGARTRDALRTAYSLAETPGGAAAILSETEPDQPGYEAVCWAAGEGLLDSFDPDAPASRRQVILLLWRMNGCPAPADSANPFTDCPADSLDAILWAYGSGIASGVGETEFAPNRACTRAELITFLWRTAGCWPAADGAPLFADTAPDAFYSSALAWAVEVGILSPGETPYFLPDTPCSQVDAVTFLYRSRNGTEYPGFLTREPGGWRFQTDAGWAADNWLIRDGRYYHFNAEGFLDRVTASAPSLVSIPGYYIHPMKASVYSSREERVEAIISTAYEYLGDPFVVYRSTAPHTDGVDCSGLVMQCLYAAGFDPYPATPEHHSYTEYDSRTLWNEVDMPHIDPGTLQRGDLVFYKKKKTSRLINHIAIYLGNGKVIEAWPDRVTDCYQVAGWPHTIIYGAARPIA